MSGRLTSAKRRALEELILDIYRAAADPDHWKVVGRRALALIGGSTFHLIMADFADDHVRYALFLNSTEARVEQYQRDVFAVDDLSGLIDHQPAAVAALTRDLDSERKWQEMPACDAFYRGVDLHHVNAANIDKRGHQNVWVSIGRSRSEPLFEPVDRQIMQTLVPHLRQAYAVTRELAAARLDAATGAELLDSMATGCVVLDSTGRALRYNDSFERYLRGDGVSLRHGRLQFASGVAQNTWQKAFASLVRAPRRGGGAFPVSAGADEYFVRVSRFNTAEPWPDFMPYPPFAVVFIARAAPGQEPSALLAGAFDLTVAETRVLVALLGDRAPKAIAADLAVSEETVRFHIRNLYRKTGSRGQLALINKAQRLLRRFAVGV